MLMQVFGNTLLTQISRSLITLTMCAYQRFIAIFRLIPYTLNLVHKNQKQNKILNLNIIFLQISNFNILNNIRIQKQFQINIILGFIKYQLDIFRHRSMEIHQLLINCFNNYNESIISNALLFKGINLQYQRIILSLLYNDQNLSNFVFIIKWIIFYPSLNYFRKTFTSNCKVYFSSLNQAMLVLISIQQIQFGLKDKYFKQFLYLVNKMPKNIKQKKREIQNIQQ
ncbi:hypothetical protein pb186bvf_000942 [Paramecium bursaria]